MHANDRSDKRLAALENAHWKTPERQVNRLRQVAAGLALLLLAVAVLTGVIELCTHGRFGVVMSFLGVLAAIVISWSAYSGVRLIIGPERLAQRRARAEVAALVEEFESDAYLQALYPEAFRRPRRQP